MNRLKRYLIFTSLSFAICLTPLFAQAESLSSVSGIKKTVDLLKCQFVPLFSLFGKNTLGCDDKIPHEVVATTSKASSLPKKNKATTTPPQVTKVIQNKAAQVKSPVPLQPAPIYSYVSTGISKEYLEQRLSEFKKNTSVIYQVGSGSYSVPPPTSVQSNTLNDAVSGLSSRISTLESATSTGGGSSQWNTSGSDISYSTGNVGISTTTPSEKLSVVGNGLFSGSVTANTFYGDGSNLTGLASTFSTSTTRSVLSSTATGLTYTSGTGVFSLTSGYNIPTTASTTEWATSFLNRITTASSPLSLSGNSLSISKASSTASGYLSSTDWSVFNSKQDTITSGTSFTANAITANTFYGDGSNLTGITSFSTSTTRSVLSSTATGLTYTSGTGVFSLTSGYVIPLTASSTNWNSFYDTPSSRITAGTGLSWSGNTLNAVGGSSQWTTSGSNIYYSTGNVGVGMSSPAYTLDVNGNINFTGTLYQNGTIFSGPQGPAGADGAQGPAGADGSCSGCTYYQSISDEGSNLGAKEFINFIGSGVSVANNGVGVDVTVSNSQWETNNSDISYSTGNVGIGIQSPSYKLHVDGLVYASGDICGSGGVYCLSSFSDQRLKKDITSFASGTLEKILSLNPVSYKWNDTYLQERKGLINATDTKFGFIAQEMDEIFPEVVVHPTTPGGFLGVDYSKLTAVLTQGIKEIYVVVQDTKAKLDSVLAWFTNGNLNIQKDVCVDDVCVTKEQFKQMLRNGGASVAPTSAPAPSAPIPVVPDTEVATSTASVDSSPVPVPDTLSTSEPVSTTPAPETTPEPTLAPDPVVATPTPEVAPTLAE